MKISRLRKAPVIKSYIAVFVCMTTHAVHIKLITNLSTETFLFTLKRFINRHGNPKIIYSNIATNFFGANNLKDLSNFF